MKFGKPYTSRIAAISESRNFRENVCARRPSPSASKSCQGTGATDAGFKGAARIGGVAGEEGETGDIGERDDHTSMLGADW